MFVKTCSPAYPAAPSNAWLFSGNNTDVKHNALIPGLNPNVNIVATPQYFIGPYQPRSDEQMSLTIGQGVVEGLTWEVSGAIVVKAASMVGKFSVPIFRLYGGATSRVGNYYSFVNPRYIPYYSKFAGLPANNS